MSDTNKPSTAQLTDLPPLPPRDATGPDVCATLRLYMAVWHDLPPAQAQSLSHHIQSCSACAQEWQVFQRVTHLMTRLEASQPSARVDQTVMAAIAARGQGRAQPARRLASQQGRRRRLSRVRGWMAAAAAVVIALLTAAYLAISGALAPQPAAFQLPANLSWNTYVLYHSQSLMDSQGEHYEVTSYHDLTDNSMNVEMVAPGKFDVVMVKDAKKSLGLDMMHHVAQWDVDDGDNEDAKVFNLQQLRQDLQNGRATYLGKGRYNNQDVYRIRRADGLIMLLDMHYMPVNVLENASGNDTGKPMYQTVRWLPPSQVPSSTWDMTVPSGFTMGTLPSMP